MTDPSNLPDLSEFRHFRNSQRAWTDADGALRTERPFVVFALLLDDTFGDFTWSVTYAMSVKLRFPGARLHVCYRDNRPFKQTVIKLSPHIDWFWKTRGETGLPITAFHRGSEGGGLRVNEAWDRSGAGEPDFFLTPSMMRLDCLGSFDPLARFRVPAEDAASADARLRALGLDPDRWFCTLHYREPSYGVRPVQTNRDIDPGIAVGAARHVIEAHGGQVVRLGHPGMTPFPTMPGLVDLADEADGTMIQAYAMSRARFFLEVSPSGPLSLAIGFGVPMARCNTNRPSGPPDDSSIVLMQHLIDPSGNRVPQDLALERNLLDDHLVDRLLRAKGYRLRQNSLAEIRAATDVIVERTGDCPGWRDQAEPVAASGTVPTSDRPGGIAEAAPLFAWPRSEVRRFSFVEFLDLMEAGD